MLLGYPQQEWQREKGKVEQKKKEPKKEKRKKSGGGGAERVKNTERKENEQGREEWPKMAHQDPRAMVCSHHTKLAERCQTSLSIACFLWFSPERTYLLGSAPRL